MKEFKVQAINYNFTFDTINNIPQKYIKNADILNEINFSLPTILPIEQSVPNEVPIVIIKNDFINAQIVICKGSLTVSFPSINGIQGVISMYIVTICNFLERLVDDFPNSIKYYGLSTSYLLEDDSAIVSIQNGLLKINDDLCDIDITYTNIKDNHFYINKKIANTRIYKQPVDQRLFGFLNNESQNALLLNIDVNNRYAFNIGQVFKADLISEIKTIETISNDCFNETYEVLKGVIDDD